MYNKLPPNVATEHKKPSYYLMEFSRIQTLEAAQLGHSDSRSHWVAGKMLVGATVTLQVHLQEWKELFLKWLSHRAGYTGAVGRKPQFLPTLT